ncbi:hydroxymethylbilane synthase [Flavobacteriales bacterium]|nr:hydroxymethylbilane synthase [Flavobacteriales bacterium]|tara:strand:- start:592 stop:1527 length:936 start_codon:yes stop_codon:yes gene_type:complete
MASKLVIGTRGSKLALYQANLVKSKLEIAYPTLEVVINVIKTKGDKILDIALIKIGDKGFFTKEIQDALYNKEVDIAVHSLKDLPTELPKGSQLGAILERVNHRDVLVSIGGKKLADFTAKDKIATSSLRRKSQLLQMNKQAQVVEIRGNVDTRIRKMNDGHCDGIIMAAAGIERLGLQEHITEYLNETQMLTAPGQGAIAIEIRKEDNEILEMLSLLNHEQSAICVTAERSFLNRLEGGCQIPFAAHATLDGDTLTVEGLVATLDGRKIQREKIIGNSKDAMQLGIDLANSIKDNGGYEILEEVKRELNN